MMVKREDVVPGAWFKYPHPSGYGLVETTVREILPPTREYPQGRVRHEAVWIGWGSVDEMDVFLTHARPR
jgi:hypothetical protein